MMKYFSSLALLFILGLATIQAQSNVEAKKLLERASTELKSHDQVFMEFSYNFENNRVDPPVVQKETGKIAVKGDDYRLEIMGMEQLRQGNKVYTILRDDEEVQITDYDQEENSGLTPTAILESFQSGYSYKLGGSEDVDGKKIKYVILKPIASEEIDRVMVGIEADTYRLYNLQQWGTNGTLTTFKITSYQPDKSLPTGYFIFDKNDYPGFYIAD